MTSAEDARQRATEVLECARSSPEDVDAQSLVDLLTSDADAARSPAATAYTLASEEDPDVIYEVADGILTILERGDDGRRGIAALTIAQLADRHPDAYEDAVPLLVENVREDFDPARNHSLRALAELAPEHPDAICRGLPALVDLLDGDLVGRVRALQVLTALSEQRPNRIGPHLEELLSTIETANADPVDHAPQESALFEGSDRKQEQSMSYRQWTSLGRILGNVAEAEPETVEQALDRIRSYVSDGSAATRSAAIHVLSVAAPARTGVLEPLSDDLLESVLSEHHPESRFRASVALCAIGLDSPEPLVGAVDGTASALGELLAVDDPRLTGAAIGIVATVAEADPTAIRDVEDAIPALLDDDISYVRANAALAAGYAALEEVLPTLREMAEEDPDEEVRNAAATAISELEPDRR